MRTESEELRTNWRCRQRGHHRWAYPREAYKSVTVPGTQVCRRAGCDAVRFVATPGRETPDAVISGYLSPDRSRYLTPRQVMGWNWGGPDPTVSDYPPERAPMSVVKEPAVG